MNISNNIKQFRELKNLSQEHMAKQLHISQSSYARIENGKIARNCKSVGGGIAPVT